MDEDKFALVEKVMKDVDNVMMKNAELCAFDIVPVEANFQNKSPVLHLENCLGLESWCVKHVYMYCYSELMDKYFAKPKRKAQKPSSVNAERLTRLLNITLLINPELNSLWNKRREMVLNCFLQKSSELQFSKLVLSRKPKCNDAFAYRRWLLKEIFKDSTLQSNHINSLANDEIYVCDLASDKSANNYHSWNHRIWIINLLKKCKNFDVQFLFIKEYDFSERWLAKHVSDYSCFHYRQFCIENIFLVSVERWSTFDNHINGYNRRSLIKTLGNNFPKDITVQASEADLLTYSDESLVNLLLSYSNKKCNCTVDNVLLCRKIEVLFHELDLNSELLRFYKYHEAMWYHRRFIVHKLISIMYDHFGINRQNGSLVKSSCGKCNLDATSERNAKIVRYDGNRIYSCVLFNVLMNYEKVFIDERRIDGDNYADRHEKYLRFIEGLNNVM
ncbi:unnamed protein product [Diatraea saccharalis]|uniref:Uncharacterized protein n=1 Tax=Diatraea saccharalis TaxID=40085 RepID=A0A9N9R7J8_9NEOP|nr:unnamed protein product [Diatraea saccharalis]